jgi:hypothetical protein
MAFIGRFTAQTIGFQHATKCAELPAVGAGERPTFRRERCLAPGLRRARPGWQCRPRSRGIPAPRCS